MALMPMRCCAVPARAIHGLRSALHPYGPPSQLHALQFSQPRGARVAPAARARHLHLSVAAADKAKVVFLGTPEVAADALERLIAASKDEAAGFEVAAVVSQPGKPRGRGRVKGEAPPSPVAARAEELGVPKEKIFTPVKAREEEFLLSMEEIAPDLCITAAYGNMLPQRFLDIPKQGTINIHPSLLPKFRGAAPVQRALESGVEETGVSVAYTVLACDAGPILAAESHAPGDEIQHPELLQELFAKGTELMLRELPAALDGSGLQKAAPQDDSEVVHADKVSPEESMLDFAQSARTLHNKVRGFAGWPGTKAEFLMENKKGEKELVVVKVAKTRVGDERAADVPAAEVTFVKKGGLQVACDDGSVLEILQLQPPGKKVMDAEGFWNGLQGRKMLRA